ncbi:NAD(P)-dependent oxidoreductase [Dactylosporangium sp. CA-233914]|uniref:NAD(P)-dependent oxidoreductase n=1 Tax=Dactylosporangium sp. CA-233914 TaxID=3239934 RepID=UPI003D8E951C
MLRVAVPGPELAEALTGTDWSVWNIGDEVPAEPFDLLVLPYMIPADELRRLPAGIARVVQSQTLGFDGVAGRLPPGFVYCNAPGVHEASTAELAVGLIVADRRGFAEFGAAQRERRWAHRAQPGLAGSRVLLVGVGGVGEQLRHKLEPFEVELVRVGQTARVDAYGPVHATGDLPRLLPSADVVVVAVPLGPGTRGLICDAFLAAMRDGALLVNVSRGPVADTDALLAHTASGRLHVALDVTDPEPLPTGHPLWTAPNVVITPHVGGHTAAMGPRVRRVVRTQIERLSAGLDPANVVVQT